MVWIYTGIILIVIIIVLITGLIIAFRKSPNLNASISPTEKEQLDKDYLSHGTHDEQDDSKNI